ncbi:hypothetical protein Salat_1201600 [Sesamum alatum]|uniref:Zinc finger GRF-type domain-containing protein n=1 Tax=Sesamum alatum TaxID=300844 RepID=A0AAE1YFN8_9LAMI|nr:hypothetical protein Salat_1201600 [Sesamum alatum]
MSERSYGSSNISCKCGKQARLKCSWTNENPGRRFYSCEDYKSECIDDVMLDVPDSAVEYGEPATAAPKKLQVKKKRKAPSPRPQVQTPKCIGEDPCPRMVKTRSQTRMVAESTMLPQPVPAASLPPRPGPSTSNFVPTPKSTTKASITSICATKDNTTSFSATNTSYTNNRSSTTSQRCQYQGITTLLP